MAQASSDSKNHPNAVRECQLAQKVVMARTSKRGTWKTGECPARDTLVTPQILEDV